MGKEISREEFLESLIEVYEDIVLKQAKLNRQLIDYLKNEKRTTKSSVDLVMDKNAILRNTDRTYLL